tara:strand:- start:64 stop:507 length:444 start_codon:yes stop_codon:yes gene_type:complete
VEPDLERLAREYREVWVDNPDGFVVFFNGEVQGWTIDLTRPEAWVAGCIAVAPDGNRWRAFGGNDYDGAKAWQFVYKGNAGFMRWSQCKQEQLPVSTSAPTLPAESEWVFFDGECCWSADAILKNDTTEHRPDLLAALADLDARNSL